MKYTKVYSSAFFYYLNFGSIFKSHLESKEEGWLLRPWALELGAVSETGYADG